MAVDGDELMKYTAVCNASAQNSVFNLAYCSIVVTRSWIVRFIRSATPFSMGVDGAVRW